MGGVEVTIDKYIIIMNTLDQWGYLICMQISLMCVSQFTGLVNANCVSCYSTDHLNIPQAK
jgi:hypothetical protein